MSRNAAAMGVRPRMPIAEAYELVCAGGPSPNVLEHEGEQDDLALQQVAQVIQQTITPMVAIAPLDPHPWAGQVLHQSDSLFCDLDGVVHLFGDERRVIDAIHAQMNELDLRAKIALADNATAAWAHAHFNRQPDFISGDDPRTELAPLPVTALRIEPATVMTLGRLGVQTIGALLKLPRSGLASRLGKPLVKRIAQVLGETHEPLSIYRSEPEYVSTLALEYPTEDQSILIDRMERLIEEIAASLAASQRGALQLACRLDLSDHSQLEFDIGLFAPTLDKKHLVCLINTCVESRRLPAAVTRITISVSLSGPLRTSQNSLFGNEMGDEMGDTPAQDVSLARFIDALSGRMGRDAVLGVKTSDDPLPENAFEVFSLTDHQRRKKWNRKIATSTRSHKNAIPGNRPDHDSRDHTPLRRSGFHSPSRHDARRRPVKLLQTPVPLAPVSLSAQPGRSRPGHLPDGFRLAGRIHRVVNHQGPERIETGWWKGPSVRRDYFVIETDSGRRWWVFRNLVESTWCLHGHFA